MVGSCSGREQRAIEFGVDRLPVIGWKAGKRRNLLMPELAMK